MRYSADAHLYCSAQPSEFSHIVLNVDVRFFLNSSIKSLLCAVVVEAYCLMSSDKNNEMLHGADMVLWMSLFLSMAMHLNVPMQYTQ